MKRQVAILGGGTAGTLTANRLHRARSGSLNITVVDQNDDHLYQPGLLFVPFGLTDPTELVRSRPRQLRAGIRYRRTAIDRVTLADGATLDYDVLVVATGAVLLPEETDGLSGLGWGNRVFTFFGLDTIHKARHEHIKLATVGNPGLHLATWAGGLPGVSSVMTHYLANKMDKLDVPPIPEFIEMIGDTGAGLYACKASADLFGLTKADFVDQVTDIITVGEFYELAAAGQIIFT